MPTDFSERVYDTLCDYLVEAEQIPGIENLFSDNSICPLSKVLRP